MERKTVRLDELDPDTRRLIIALLAQKHPAKGSPARAKKGAPGLSRGADE